MAGYTKLFNSILASTIWEADMPTRIVWITLLAMADKHGIAEGSVPGLATFARVSLKDCRKALAALQAPDLDSRSKEQDGCRIEAVEGGWHLINHAKYRAKMGADERREYLRLKQAEYRAKTSKSTNVNNVSDKYTLLTHAEAEAEAEAKKNVPAPSALAASFLAFWESYPKKKSRADAEKAWRTLAPSPDLLQRIMAALAAQRASRDWTKEAGKYIPFPATWLRGRRWDDSPEASDGPGPTSIVAETWQEACKRLHGGTCEERIRHRHQMALDQLRVQAREVLTAHEAPPPGETGNELSGDAARKACTTYKPIAVGKNWSR